MKKLILFFLMILLALVVAFAMGWLSPVDRSAEEAEAAAERLHPVAIYESC